nr:hypothetical protein [Tanacetum cinerariifolium]
MLSYRNPSSHHAAKATLAKITISGEATSPDNHMFTADRRLNIMSGGGTSSKKSTLDEPASAKDLNSSNSPLFLDELQVGVTGIIFVILCQIWDVSAVTCWYLSTDMVVSDTRVADQTKQIMPVDFGEPRAGTLETSCCGRATAKITSTISRREMARTSPRVARKSVRKELAESWGDGGVTLARKQ